MAGTGGIVKMGEKELATLASKNPEYFAKIEKALAKQGGGLSKAFGITGLGLGAGAAGGAIASNSPVSEQTNTVGSGLVTASGSSDTSGGSGSGSLPARRSKVSPRISATMSTDKLLVTAIGYLASIDSSIKEQNDLTRFKFTSDENAKRESAFESKKGLTGGAAMSPMTAISRQAEKIGDGLLGALGKMGLIVAAMSASKVVKWVFENPGKALSIAGTAGIALMGAKPALAAAKTVGTIAAAKAAPVLGKMAASAGELILKIPGLSSISKLIGPASKTGILNLAKKIPFIGALVGLGLAYMRFKEGDLLGAGLQAVSGFLPMFGPLGIAAAFALDAGLVVRDIKKEVAPALTNESRGNAPRPNNGVTPRGRGNGAPIRNPMSAGTNVYENIQKAEGTFGKDPYNTSLGYIDPMTEEGWKGAKKPLSQMTMTESLQWGEYIAATVGKDKKGRGRAYSSSAKGAFQIVNDTQKDAMADLGLKGTDPFNEKNQKRMADWILQKPGQGFSAWEGFKKHPELLKAAKSNYAASIKNNPLMKDISAGKPPQASEKIANAAAAAPPRQTTSENANPSNVIVNNNNVNATNQQSSGGKVPNPQGPKNDLFAYFSTTAMA